MTDIRERLLTANPWKLMVTLSLPAILGQFVVGFYAFIDSIFVGQLVGTAAMSAVSAASPFVLINNGIAVLIGIGSGSVVSRAIGKKDVKTVNKIMGNLAFLVLLFSAIAMALGIAFAPQLLRLAGAEGNILELGVAYLRIIFLGSIFVNFMQSANMVMRAEGRMGLAMGIMAGGAILNIILDPVFITLLPQRGPQAAAMATVISQFIQASVTLIYFLRLQDEAILIELAPFRALNEDSVVGDASGEPLRAEIFANTEMRAPESYDHAIIDQTGFEGQILFTAERPIYDFQILSLELLDVTQAGELVFDSVAVYEKDAIQPERPLLVSLTFFGDLPSYGFSYTDESGDDHRSYLGVSGRDGSLVVRAF